MKIAHLCNYAPHESGMYETVKSLVIEEIAQGCEAGLIDTIANVKQYGTDGFMPEPLSFGDDADIICWHHAAYEPWLNDKRKNIVMFLHGTPEFSFFTELNGDDRPLSVVVGAANLDLPAGYVTFWKRHVPFWEHLLDRPVHCIPPPVDLKHFPVSERKPSKKVIKLAIMDYWRLTREPFQLLTAVDVLRKTQGIRVQLDIWGAPNPLPDVWKVALQRLADAGVLHLHDRTLTPWTDIYNKTDVILTMATESTRVVREATAAGVPVVCGPAAFDPDAPFYDTRLANAEFCATAILQAFNQLIVSPEETRTKLHDWASINFSAEESVAQLLPVFENILGSRKEESAKSTLVKEPAEPPDKPGTDVIVLNYGQPEMTSFCLTALQQTLVAKCDRLLWIDNGSTDEEHKQVEAGVPEVTSFGQTLLVQIRSDKNRGFAVGANLGIRQALVDQQCEYIALVNNDVEVYSGWLAKLLKAMEVYRFSAICPLTNGEQPTGMATISKLMAEDDRLPPDLIADGDDAANGLELNQSLWERYGTRCYVCNKMLSFFCCVLRRRAFEEVGLLDEHLFAYGEDNDWFARARKSELTFGVARGVYVHHIGAVTSKTLPGGPEELKKQSGAYLEKKHKNS